MAIWIIGLSLLSIVFGHANLFAQPTLKKVRMGIQSTNIGFLPFHIAFHKGFYREQGIDLEMIFMSTQAVNAAFVRGDLDYSAAVNGIIQGIVRGAPAKILACAVDRPLQSFISRKDIRGPRDLKGKKVAGSTTGGTATLMADAALKHFGLESGRDVSVIPLRDNRLTALESGTVDAALLGVPENIIAVDKGYNELLFLGDVLSFPQNGFGASTKQRNRDEVINIILKQWRLTDRRLAGEMLKQFGRGIIRDMSVRSEGIQLMIDLVRDDAKIAQPFSVSQVADFSFLEKALRELGVTKP
ncbi:MAG TPA: ABC transporter substrate-binding protein [Candidatus Binatia bacterium]|nr:ABC transporter substrate-binding protein [Candidatus Binatia bacterium]